MKQNERTSHERDWRNFVAARIWSGYFWTFFRLVLSAHKLSSWKAIVILCCIVGFFLYIFFAGVQQDLSEFLLRVITD